jgi:hypothetical protein
VDDGVVVVDGTGADEPEAVDGAAVDDVEAVTGATEVEPGVVAGATLACATSAADPFDRTGPSERAPGNSHHVAARAATPIMANTATIATAAPRRCGIATAGTEVAPTAPSACVAPVGAGAPPPIGTAAAETGVGGVVCMVAAAPATFSATFGTVASPSSGGVALAGTLWRIAAASASENSRAVR